MKILNGKAIAKEIKRDVKNEVNSFFEKWNYYPKLTVILVGNNPASEVYVKNKMRACKRTNILSETIKMDASISENQLLETIEKLNNDTTVSGILVQLPLPKQINEDKILMAIDPNKDVDCFHPWNIGEMMLNKGILLPCTPAGIVEILRHEGINIDGKNVVILGRSNIVGKPLANMLLSKTNNATVTICHSHTKNLKEHTKRADILIAAIGKPEFIDSSYIKDDAIIIDVGIHRKELANGDKILVGDVNFDDVKDKVAAITPVPGGVGPMTIAMLMKNTLTAAKIQAAKRNS